MNDSPLIVSIQSAGLSHDESAVYLALLSLGKATASEIAKQANIKRPQTYHVLESLQTSGYVIELIEHKVKRFSATDPMRLFQDLSVRTEQFREMLPVLRAMLQNEGLRPHIEFFEGKMGVEKVYRMLRFGKRSRYVSTYSGLQKYFPAELEYWKHLGQSSKDKNISDHLIVDEPEGLAFARAVTNKKTQSFRLLPKGQSLGMDFAIVDDMLAITSFDPLFVVVIFSERIAKSAAVLFDLAWESARPLR